ncbi:transposase [Streptomyces rimosus subsp. rimosus]|nr:transposase [Streptomyces rimosus subsp. rimosus]
MMADFVTGRWSAELEVLFLRVSGRFGRIEVRRRMRDYVPGLLGPVSRKNSPPEGAPPRQLAECAGHNGPYGLQHLLDPDELRDDVQSYVAEKLGAPGGVLIVDDTGFVKQGTVSAGVQRQYSGTAGACP